MDLFNLAAKLTMDTRDYEKGLKDAISSSKNVEQAMKNLKSPLDKARDGFNAIRHPVETAKEGFSAIKNKVSELAHPVQNIKNKFQETAAAMETQRNKLSVLTGNYDDAKKKVASLTDEFNKSVKETGATSAESKKLADALKKAEQEADDAKKEMDDYADSLNKTGKKSDEAESKTRKLANALKSGIANGAKLAAKGSGIALAAGAAAVTKIVKDSVSAYGEFEQLRGGAQKIFGNMDYSQIQADASMAYKNLNMSATEYLASINQVGATFKSTMGDQKAYETAKTGMQAIADYASGTGKNISELNEKYALITRSTASYQSIADQFSGVLPQTNKDFLKQAQAAGFLSDKYKELTQVPVAEYQEAVTKMIEKGVAAQGLAGNTAAESAKTLTGSIAMTKAAWENLLVGLSDPTQNVGQLVSRLIESAGSAVENLIPVIKEALKGIGSAAKDLAPALGEALIGLATDVLPDLVSSAVTLVVELGKALADNAELVIDGVFQIIDVIVASLSDPNGLITLIDAAFQIIMALANGLTENLPTLLPAIMSIVMDIAEKLLAPENLLQLQEAAISLLLALADGLINSIDVLLARAPEIIAGYVSALIQAAPRLFEAAVALLGKLAEGIKNAMSTIWEVGKGIVQGIWQGITNSLEWIKGKIKGWVGNVMSFLKGLFGIHSPSKWANNVIGKNLVLGMAQGISDNEDVVTDAMDNLTKGISASSVLSLGESIPSLDGNVVAGTMSVTKNDKPADKIDRLIYLLETYLPEIGHIELDGEVVANSVDRRLGRIAAQKARV